MNDNDHQDQAAPVIPAAMVNRCPKWCTENHDMCRDAHYHLVFDANLPTIPGWRGWENDTAGTVGVHVISHVTVTEIGLTIENWDRRGRKGGDSGGCDVPLTPAEARKIADALYAAADAVDGGAP